MAQETGHPSASTTANEKKKLLPKAHQSKSLTLAQLLSGEESHLPSVTAQVTQGDCPVI